MSEIRLTMRYPESRLEDVTDAYMRGVAAGMEIADSRTVRRIDALERRIEKLEQRMDGKDGMDSEMLLSIGKRLCAIERKLNHKTREDA